jgi:hypothetical protein
VATLAHTILILISDLTLADAANSDTTTEDEVIEQAPSEPPAQFAGSDVEQTQQAVPSTKGVTKRSIPDFRSLSPTPAKKKKRRTKQKPLEPEDNKSDETARSTLPNSNHTLPHQGGEQLRHSQRFCRQDVDVLPVEDETPVQESPVQTRMVDTKPLPAPTGMIMPVPPGLGGSSQKPIIVESLYVCPSVTQSLDMHTQCLANRNSSQLPPQAQLMVLKLVTDSPFRWF